MSNILHETKIPEHSPAIKLTEMPPSERISHAIELESHPEKASKKPVTRLIMICNAEEMLTRYSDLGFTDSGLTAKGWEQATRLANWLKTHEKIDTLLSGPQLHSRFTAQRIGYALGLSVKIESILSLAETNEAIASPRSPATLASLHCSTQNAKCGPSAKLSSILNYLDERSQAQSGTTIAIVMNRYMIAQLLTGLMGYGLEIHLSHTGITELRFQNDRWKLHYINRCEHRPTPQIVPLQSKTDSDQNGIENGEANASATEPREHLQAIKKVYNNALCTGGDLVDQVRRERIQHLLRFANLPPRIHSLDVGTGAGILPLLLAAGGADEAIGIDISPSMLECAEYLRLSDAAPHIRSVNYRLARAQWLPFRQERFDAVLCRMVLHLNHKPEKIVQEAFRILKHDGVFVLAGLLCADDPVKRATQNVIEERRNPCHVAARSAEYYRKLLTDIGLTIQEEETAIFARELEEWLDELQTSEDVRATVRGMMEASLETDAAGINARRDDEQLLFDQRLIYLKAVKG